MNKDLYDGLYTKPPLDELYHHGVQGQKWGVKHGPPYPLSRQKKGNGRLASGKGSIQKKKNKPRKVWSYAMLEKDLRTGRRELTKEEYNKLTIFKIDPYTRAIPGLTEWILDNDPNFEKIDPLHPEETVKKFREDVRNKEEVKVPKESIQEAKPYNRDSFSKAAKVANSNQDMFNDIMDRAFMDQDRSAIKDFNYEIKRVAKENGIDPDDLETIVNEIYNNREKTKNWINANSSGNMHKKKGK